MVKLLDIVKGLYLMWHYKESFRKKTRNFFFTSSINKKAKDGKVGPMLLVGCNAPK